jgi:general secretion pathway protein J
MSSSPGRHRGFTLIEVLVSLSLMSLMATIMIASLELGGHTWRRVTRQVSDTDDIAQAQRALRQWLASLYPYQNANTEGAAPGFLVSDGETIEFSGLASGSIADGILRYHIGRSKSATATLDVQFRRDHNGLSDDSSPDWSNEVLLKGVAGVAIRFWSNTDDTAGRWIDRWIDQNHIPRLIRIDVSFAAGDRRRWPSLFVEPRVDTNARCVFDVVSRRCRGGV